MAGMDYHTRTEDEYHPALPSSHLIQLDLSSSPHPLEAPPANRPRSPRSMSSHHWPPEPPQFQRYRDQEDWDDRWLRRSSQISVESDWTSDDEFAAGEYPYMDEKDDSPYRKASAYGYSTHRPRRPLVDFVRNEWRNNPRYSQTQYPSSEREYHDHPHWTRVLTAPRFRRYIVAYALLMCLCWTSWRWWLGPMWNEHTLLRGSLDERMKTGIGWFGANMRPKFSDITQLSEMDAALLPTGGRYGRRLIVVGDVHGCHDELVSLLAKLSYKSTLDHIVLAGDIISKGPSSPAVVSLAMSLNASCVRGNHEDRVLLANRDMNTHYLSLPGPHEALAPPLPSVDNLDEESFSHGDYTDRKLAKSLSREQLRYLAACPLILKVGDLRDLGGVSVVHAGLVPGVDLERQDPSAVMTMRTVDLDTHVPSRDDDGVPWSKLWNKYQSLLPRSQRQTIVYGHDSRRGLQLSKYSKGVDTGCVKGGKLTALVIEEGKWGGNTRTRTVSVKCKDYRTKKKAQVGLGQA